MGEFLQNNVLFLLVISACYGKSVNCVKGSKTSQFFEQFFKSFCALLISNLELSNKNHVAFVRVPINQFKSCTKSFLLVSAQRYELRCPRGWRISNYRYSTACLRLTPAFINWYDSTQQCEKMGGTLYDGGDIEKSLAAQALLSEGSSDWHWVNAVYLNVVGGKVWTFDDGKIIA